MTTESLIHLVKGIQAIRGRDDFEVWTRCENVIDTIKAKQSEISLVKRLRIVADMINMGEKISWGEETTLMDQAADEIERLSKPVIVDLEQGALAAQKEYLRQIESKNPTFFWNDVAGEVALAWGLKYA